MAGGIALRWRDAFAGMRGRIALAVAVFATLALLAAERWEADH